MTRFRLSSDTPSIMSMAIIAKMGGNNTSSIILIYHLALPDSTSITSNLKPIVIMVEAISDRKSGRCRRCPEK
jgi:hypothetical protein